MTLGLTYSAMNVLLADDNTSSAKLVELSLTGPHCRLLIARNGREAIEWFSRFQPSLVLLDIQMPEVSGVGVMHELRRQDRGTRLPIIAITAQASVGQTEEFIREGFDGVINKPFKISTLKSDINVILRANGFNELL